MRGPTQRVPGGPDIESAEPLTQRARPGAWLTAIPAEPATTLPPWAPDAHGAAAPAAPSIPPFTRCNAGGDLAAAVASMRWVSSTVLRPHSGLLAPCGFGLELEWAVVLRDASGRVVPQQWLANTTAPAVAAQNRRPLPSSGQVLCYDAALVSPLRRRRADRDGAAIATACRRKVARRFIRSCYAALRIACIYGQPKWAAGGAVRPRTSCGASSLRSAAA